MHFRLEPNAVTTKEYADRDAIFDDLAKTYKQAVHGFYDAGCRYLQFDDTAWAYLCSPAELKKAKERGLNADHLATDYARVINQALADKPADMVITTHVCRGNFRSTWISEGGYEPIAEIMLGALNYDGYFLEYDSERAGGFEPLRFLPKGNKIVVLGLVTSKSGTLEKKADVKKRIEEATKFARARSARAVAAMRLRLDRGRQRARRRRAVGEAAHGRGAGRRSVGLRPIHAVMAGLSRPSTSFECTAVKTLDARTWPGNDESARWLIKTPAAAGPARSFCAREPSATSRTAASPG